MDLIAASALVILHKLDSNRRFFSPCDLEIWWITSENNRAPFLCCFRPRASFHSHQWIQTGVTVRKCQIWVTIDDFFSPCDLEIWQMTLKKLGHLFYATYSFVHHFKAIYKFKLKLQSVKIVNFLSHVAVKFYGWPSKTIGHLFYVASSFVHYFIAISEF